MAATTSMAPWAKPYYESYPDDKGWWIHNGHRGAREHAVAVTFALNKQGEQDARWIALASPAIAEPLAAMLLDKATVLSWATDWSQVAEDGYPDRALCELILGASDDD